MQSVSVCKIDPAGTPSILAVLIHARQRSSRELRRIRRTIWRRAWCDCPGEMDGSSGTSFSLIMVFLRPWREVPEIGLGDLDGDRSLDAAVLFQLGNVQENRGLELRAVSLRDGKPIWSRKIPTYHVSARSVVAVGDLDGDNHAEVVTLTQRPSGAIMAENVLEAFDGRDGRSLWIKHGEIEEIWRNNGAAGFALRISTARGSAECAWA